MDDDRPCCANEALRRVKIIQINGVPTGIVMLEKIFEEVREMKITDETRIREALLEKVKVYNYVPKSATEIYARTLLEEYRKGA
jgi:hypothetical protein